jgi:IS605 OrfB family transposase
MKRTIKLVLPCDKRVAETVRVYNQACNFMLAEGFRLRTYNKLKLHRATYKAVRERWPALNSSYVCAARDQASDMLKREKLRVCPHKKEFSSIRFNHNTFKPFLQKGIISLSTTLGRVKLPVKIPPHFGLYTTWKISSATLSIKGGRIHFNLTAEAPDVEKVAITKAIGIDRGVINPAVTSSAQFFNSRNIRAVKGKYQWLKSQLQSKGTRSAKRHLRRLKGREQRFMRDVNHCISKKIALGDAQLFVIEKLGIRRSKGNGKRFNRLLGTWAFRQFEEFLKYKAGALGKTVEHVNPKHTSQTCSSCGQVRKANRKGVWYRCNSCGLTLNADLNAARNILALSKLFVREAAVNQPIVTSRV